MKPLLAHWSCSDQVKSVLTQWNRYWHSGTIIGRAHYNNRLFRLRRLIYCSWAVIATVVLLLRQWNCYWHNEPLSTQLNCYGHSRTVIGTAEPFLEQWRHYWDCRTVILAQWSLCWQRMGSRFWHSGAVIDPAELLLTQRNRYWHSGAVIDIVEISSAVWHTYPRRPCTPSPSPSARSP